MSELGSDSRTLYVRCAVAHGKSCDLKTPIYNTNHITSQSDSFYAVLERRQHDNHLGLPIQGSHARPTDTNSNKGTKLYAGPHI